MTEETARLAAVRSGGVLLAFLLLAAPCALAGDGPTSEGLTPTAAPADASVPVPTLAEPAADPAEPDLAEPAADLPPSQTATVPPDLAPADLARDEPADDGEPAEPSADEAPTEPELDSETLLRLAQQDLSALGPLSIGTPDAGLLVNPRPMPEGSLWTIRNPLETFGTQETIDYISTAIGVVEARHPGSPRVVIGDISRPDGGRLNRHKSHQAGRDVDIGFYYEAGEAGDFRAARRGQIDLPRTWALVRAFVTETDVDRVFVDRTIISVLYRYAREVEGEDVGWLDDVFGRAGRKGIVQHERRHKDHLHVRFFSPVAQERGRVVHAMLVETGVVGPPTVKHRARRGDTIGGIASRYGSSVSAIRSANGLRSNRLRAGRSYVVPVRRVREQSEPIVVPSRRLPPSPATQAAAAPESPAPDVEATAPASTPAAGGGRRD